MLRKRRTEKSVSEEDTLARIEAVTDRLEWLAKEIEKQLEKGDRGGGT